MTQNTPLPPLSNVFGSVFSFAAVIGAPQGNQRPRGEYPAFKFLVRKDLVLAKVLAKLLPPADLALVVEGRRY